MCCSKHTQCSSMRRGGTLNHRHAPPTPRRAPVPASLAARARRLSPAICLSRAVAAAWFLPSRSAWRVTMTGMFSAKSSRRSMSTYGSSRSEVSLASDVSSTSDGSCSACKFAGLAVGEALASRHARAADFSVVPAKYFCFSLRSRSLSFSRLARGSLTLSTTIQVDTVDNVVSMS